MDIVEKNSIARGLSAADINGCAELFLEEFRAFYNRELVAEAFEAFTRLPTRKKEKLLENLMI